MYTKEEISKTLEELASKIIDLESELIELEKQVRDVESSVTITVNVVPEVYVQYDENGLIKDVSLQAKEGYILVKLKNESIRQSVKHFLMKSYDVINKYEQVKLDLKQTKLAFDVAKQIAKLLASND